MRMRLVAGVWIAARPLAGHIQTSHARGVDADPHCGLFSKVQKTLRSSVGKRVDRVTRFSGIDVDCHQKSVVFRQTVSLESRQLAPALLQRHGRHRSKT